MNPYNKYAIPFNVIKINGLIYYARYELRPTIVEWHHSNMHTICHQIRLDHSRCLIVLLRGGGGGSKWLNNTVRKRRLALACDGHQREERNPQMCLTC